MTILQPTLTKPSRPTIQSPPTNEHGKKVSLETYWAHYYEHPDFSYEWHNGTLEVKSMASLIEFDLYAWHFLLLKVYLQARAIGVLIGLETGFQMTLAHKISVRKPDLAVILNSNAIQMSNQERKYRGVFDVCVEGVSASSKKEIERDTVIKLDEYRLAGVKEYYILDERGTETAFLHNVNGVFRPLPNLNGVIRSVVLPGFQFREADLQRRPPLQELADDPVYQGYVLPEHQRLKQQLAWERRQREVAEQLAQQVQEQVDTERREKEQAQQQLLNTARNLLPVLDDAAISDITGVDLATVQRLRNS